MSWLELSITIAASQRQRIEDALDDLGAMSITLQDADADTPDERAIFEPGVGETPVWNEVVVQALFPAACDRAGLVHALNDSVPELVPERLAWREIADQDWTRAWLADFKPMRFGTRLWICPADSEPPLTDAASVIVRLDPGLAFGTGTHPTTAMCLEWLDGASLGGRRVIDYGCGSGVLGIAAVKLGAAHVIAIDNDAQALVATRANAERNGVQNAIDLHTPDSAPATRADVLIANILAGPLHELAPRFAAVLVAGGMLVLSGILHGQEDELLARYAGMFERFAVTRRDDWVRISAMRNTAD